MDFEVWWPLPFFLIFFGLGGWSLYERYGFTRFDGPMKRGIGIGGETLSWEMRQFLEAMPESIRYDKRFIRLEGRERLISEERSWWRRNAWYYVGYIDLRSPDGQLEIRMPASNLAGMLLTIPIAMFVFSTGFIFRDLSIFSLIFPIFILTIAGGSFFFQHQRERKRILSILQQALMPPSF